MSSHIVKVSARTNIAWPPLCPCCLRPADCQIEAVATRTEGVRVVRTKSKSWVVPYCRACIRHIRALPGLVEARGNRDRIRSNPPELIQACITPALAGLGACCGLFVAACGGLGVAKGADREAVPVLLLIFFAALGLGAWTVFLAANVPHTMARKWEDHAAQLAAAEGECARAEAAAATSAPCCARDQAVRYLAWRDTIHEFAFANERYASLFRTANRDKVVL